MEASGSMTWNGAEQLRSLLVALDTIDHHPENPRRGDVDMIAESLSFFGQLKPIVLHTYAGQDKPYIVAGNHTTRGARQNEWTHIAAVLPDITDQQADQFLLLDNRSSDVAENDEAMLAVMLERMMDAGQLSGTGYTPDDVDDLLSELGKVAVTPDQEFQGDYAETPEDTAARYTAPGEGVRMREALLMYPEAQFEEFSTMLRALQKEWGIDSARDVVFEAIRRAAAGVDVEASVPADA